MSPRFNKLFIKLLDIEFVNFSHDNNLLPVIV